jgi:hypothetical protein
MSRHRAKRREFTIELYLRGVGTLDPCFGAASKSVLIVSRAVDIVENHAVRAASLLHADPKYPSIDLNVDRSRSRSNVIRNENRGYAFCFFLCKSGLELPTSRGSPNRQRIKIMGAFGPTLLQAAYLSK